MGSNTVFLEIVECQRGFILVTGFDVLLYADHVPVLA
jgi:hypothetical protein